MTRPCSICGSRDAVYYQSFSGDYLCIACLRKRLIKYVRKAFSKYEFSIPPGASIILLITPAQTPIRHAVEEIFAAAERPFTTKITTSLMKPGRDIVEAQREAVEEATKNGYRLVMLSTTLEERLLELLTTLMRRHSLDPSCRGLYRHGDTTVFKPFSFTSLQDLYAYAAATGKLSHTPRTPYLYEQLLAAAWGGPELAYSYRRVLRRLLEDEP
ncbi:MAG: hypothetical protein GXO09_03580 [Crenarchaeota archaeon]|nr:hypothetical protein [Thermoproteota archaeon]